ncbi:MAG: T9SS type A sorting domain-containing protein [Owenweeksia sp.]|nr:T9SS type A sorting domain-containing protein [Owenweeksia sp.]
MPNPVINGLLMIDGLAADEQVDLQIFTLGGKLVHLEEDITGQPAGFNRPEINIEGLANGLYLARILGAGETSLQKIIIDR